MGEHERLAPHRFQLTDVQQVARHHPVADPGQPRHPLRLLPRPRQLPVVAQQPDPGEQVRPHPPPLRQRRPGDELRCPDVHGDHHVVRDHPQLARLGRRAHRLLPPHHGLGAAPPLVLPEEPREVDVPPQVVARPLQVGPRTGRAHHLRGGVEPVERDPLVGRQVLVVVPHPRDQPPVPLQLPQPVREPVPHRRVERPHALPHVVVHDERRRPVGLDGDRPEPVLDQPGEQLVAHPLERRFEVGRLAEGQQVARRGHEAQDVLTHEVQAYP